MADDRTTEEFVAFCRELMKDTRWRDQIAVAWRERKLELSRGELTIIAYAVGKPIEQVKHEFPNASRKLSEMSNADLAKLAATLSQEAISLERSDGKAN